MASVGKCDGTISQPDRVDLEPTRQVIVNEMLCYIQNRMNNVSVDYLEKSVCNFYNDVQVEGAKTQLFDYCREGTRHKKRQGPRKKSQNVTDIIDKFNEVGCAVPHFVAQNIVNLPAVSLESFDLAKLSNDLGNVMALEQNLTSVYSMITNINKSLENMAQLQTDVAIIKARLVDMPVQQVNIVQHQPETVTEGGNQVELVDAEDDESGPMSENDIISDEEPEPADNTTAITTADTTAPGVHTPPG